MEFKKYRYSFFLIGIFFLPSTLFLSIIFLFPAALIGSLINEKKFYEDANSKSFLVCSGLIVLSALCQNFLFVNQYEGFWDPKNSLIGITNWLPLFWFFWAFQPFLNTKNKRERFAKIALAGSIPVIITGFGQYFFDWFGPFETFNGLIVWYQRPMVNNEGLTGLFSNQNYAGSWLNFILPFSIALVFERTENIIKKNLSIVFLISIGVATFLTHSRNAWAGLVIILPIVIGQESLIWLMPILFSLLIFFIFVLSPIFSGPIQEFLKDLIPLKSLINISQTFQFTDYKISDGSRLSQLLTSINIIKNNLWFGVGATSFSAIYLLENEIFRGHSHNIITELAISFGLPVTLILIGTLCTIIISSGKIIFFERKLKKNYNYYERAIWASILFFVFSQMFDIQYFDGRMSIFSWTLLACLRNIIYESKIINK